MNHHHHHRLAGIASFLLLQLLLLSNSCSAKHASDDVNPLERLLMDRFSSSSSSSTSFGFLRKLASRKLSILGSSSSSSEMGDEDVTAMMREFGPGADWSCTAESNDADDFNSCIESTASKKFVNERGCSWCPLGSHNGVCVRSDQATVINGFENEHLLHLKCYNDEDVLSKDESYGDDVYNDWVKNRDATVKNRDAIATTFWDEAFACMGHSRDDCGGDHGDHSCTYCTVDEPAMGLCLSVSLWDNMIVAQALEEFDANVGTRNQIQLDQVIHCRDDGKYEDDEAWKVDDSVWTSLCHKILVTDGASEEECRNSEKGDCVFAESLFPGFLGSKAGLHCMSIHQQRAMEWAIELLGGMGWTEMEKFQ
jgi:hypothetical protein